MTVSSTAHTHTHTHTHTQPFYCSSGLCLGPPGWAGTRNVKPGSGICWAICNAYSLRPPARSPPAPLRATHGFTSSPTVHTRRVPPCMAQSRLGAFPR